MNHETKPVAPAAFMEFKKYREHEWFRLLFIFLTALGLLYIYSHVVIHKDAGYEYERLDKGQLQHINTIYLDSVNQAEEAPDGILRRKSEKVISYIQNQFNNKVDPLQISRIRPDLYAARQLEAISYLGTLRLRVQSYFWLVGPEVYFEIIFWSLFGVLASILFNLGMVGRNSTTEPGNARTIFDSSEIPYQFAKLLYAPLCTLSIVLGYNFFNDQNIVDISSSKGVIVFAFLGGFYSSRLIAFMDRLKEVILPVSGTTDLQVNKQTAPVLLRNITLDLQPDPATLPAEQLSSIAEIGLGSATVVLEHEETGEVVPAERAGEDQAAIFSVTSLKPGKYTIKASWSKEVDEEPLTLEAEQREEIKNGDMTLVVLMKRAPGEG
ncbi:hypothetical protein V9K67_09450 [Paraflavisolibacter sp. H34]|uniref:hypothetical protein n=1 Tax=Huijunlia imazamoxiresistens TaxID=3127457 RepID=UPI003015FF17